MSHVQKKEMYKTGPHLVRKREKSMVAGLSESDIISRCFSGFNTYRGRISIPRPCMRDEATYLRYMLARAGPPHPRCQLF